MRQVEALYDAALTSVDQAIEWLFGRLEEQGLRGRTLVIITSDHGEEFYDLPDISGHGDFVDLVDSQAVPILLLGPGVPTGQVSNRQVRLYDLGATVLLSSPLRVSMIVQAVLEMVSPFETKRLNVRSASRQAFGSFPRSLPHFTVSDWSI
jgi:membrane-anchored protein YejM (alkaline phosphatase superfamily)